MNIQALMKQAQSLQNEMMKTKEEIDNMTFIGESSVVKVTINGKKQLLKVNIQADSEVSSDLEMLEDMILVATNQALDEVDRVTEEKMGKYSKAMPGLF